MLTAKTLIRLGGCPGRSESSLGADSLCWICHVAAHIILYLAARTLTLLRCWLENFSRNTKFQNVLLVKYKLHITVAFGMKTA